MLASRKYGKAMNRKKSTNCIKLKKINSSDKYNKDTLLLHSCNVNNEKEIHSIFNKRNDQLASSKAMMIHIKPIKQPTTIVEAKPPNSIRFKSVLRSRNIRSLSTCNNPSKSTAQTKGLIVPSISSEEINSYKKLYKYSFITKKEKIYDRNADCDTDANEEEKKELMFMKLSEKYNFIPTQLNRYEQKFYLIKDIFRYPKLEAKMKRQNEIMLQKLKNKYSTNKKIAKIN